MVRNENHCSLSKCFVYITAGKTWRHAFYTVCSSIISIDPNCGITTWQCENISRGNCGEWCGGGGYCLLRLGQIIWQQPQRSKSRGYAEVFCYITHALKYLIITIIMTIIITIVTPRFCTTRLDCSLLKIIYNIKEIICQTLKNLNKLGGTRSVCHLSPRKLAVSAAQAVSKCLVSKKCVIKSIQKGGIP